MAHIITITFNPSIDKSTTVPGVEPDIKLHCTPPIFEPGGGGINVARALKKLGSEAFAIYPSGGISGRFLNSLLAKEGLKSCVVMTEADTRENLIVLDTATNKQYRFGMPGAELAQSDWEQCLHLAEQVENVAFIVGSGSLPPGVPSDVFARLARIAKTKGAKCIVDTSGAALELALNEGIYLAKPNLKELAFITGQQDMTADTIYKSAGQLAASGKAEAVVVSLGPAGAMLVTRSEGYRILPPPVDVKSTVGAGDSMVAGIVWGLSNAWGLAKTARFGVACGTAATLNPGTALCNLEDVLSIYANTTSERLDPVAGL